MVLGHLSNDGQAYTCSPVFGVTMKAGEYIKDAVGVFLLKANALVYNIDRSPTH